MPKAEDAWNQMPELGAKIAQLEDEKAEKTGCRKELGRKDAESESLVMHAVDELRGPQQTLASMMDKGALLVSCFSSR